MKSTKKPRVLVALVLTLFVALNPPTFADAGVDASEDSRSGVLSGLNGHVTVGQVTLVRDGDTWKVILGEDFSFDGAPDPKVALGKDGKYDPTTLLQPLKSNTGAQSYSLPVSVDGSKFNEVYIWCEQFSIGLGVASLD